MAPPPDSSLTPATVHGGPAGATDQVPVGPYRLLRPLGAGGMGLVYLAEQSEPVRRQVALKLLKPGMDSRQVVARFESERQALAVMEHPSLARVFDAGGLPYFVMEYVDGVPITEFCDSRRLSPRERARLFVQVCRAVQHAHQKGVIPRDLKPSNVPVTAADGEPLCKIIDLGIARAVERSGVDAVLLTQVDQPVGTPAYMSPEQAQASGLDVDTRTDLPSLGVLLYQLLDDLQRRRVYRLAAGYAAGVFVVLQVAELVTPTLGAPEWAYRALILFALGGMPVALALGWIFDLSAEGIRRTLPAPPAAAAGWRRSQFPLAVSLALGVAVGWWALRQG